MEFQKQGVDHCAPGEEAGKPDTGESCCPKSTWDEGMGFGQDVHGELDTMIREHHPLKKICGRPDDEIAI